MIDHAMIGPATTASVTIGPVMTAHVRTASATTGLVMTGLVMTGLVMTGLVTTGLVRNASRARNVHAGLIARANVTQNLRLLRLIGFQVKACQQAKVSRLPMQTTIRLCAIIAQPAVCVHVPSAVPALSVIAMMRLLHSILQACRLQLTFAANQNLTRLRHLLPLHLLRWLQKTHQQHQRSAVARARLLCPSKAEM